MVDYDLDGDYKNLEDKVYSIHMHTHLNVDWDLCAWNAIDYDNKRFYWGWEHSNSNHYKIYFTEKQADTIINRLSKDLVQGDVISKKEVNVSIDAVFLPFQDPYLETFKFKGYVQFKYLTLFDEKDRKQIEQNYSKLDIYRIDSYNVDDNPRLEFDENYIERDNNKFYYITMHYTSWIDGSDCNKPLINFMYDRRFHEFSGFWSDNYSDEDKERTFYFTDNNINSALKKLDKVKVENATFELHEVSIKDDMILVPCNLVAFDNHCLFKAYIYKSYFDSFVNTYKNMNKIFKDAPISQYNDGNRLEFDE